MDMGDKKFNDRLEEIFSERLSEDTPERSSWNTPSDELWERIARDVPQRPRRRLWFWLLLGTALLLLLLIDTCQLNLFESQPEEVSSTPIATQKSKPQANSTPPQISVQSQSSSPAQQPAEQPSPTPQRTETRATVNPGSKLLVEKTAPILPGGMPVDTFSEKTTDIAADTLAKQSIVALDDLATKNFVPGFSGNRSVEAPAFAKTANDWMLETMVGYALGLRQYVVNTNTVHLNLNDTRTFSAGFNLEKNLGKNWSMGLGIQYSRLAFDANYDVHLSYSEAGEQEQMDGFAKAYEENLPSLVGSLNTQLLLFRATGDEVVEGEDVPVTVHLNHSIEYLSLPIFVKFRQIEKRLGWYIRAGLIPGTVVGALDTEHLATHAQHERLHHQASSFALEKETAIEQNPVTLLYSGSLGLNYKLTPSQHLFIEPGLWGELIPTYPNDALSKKALHLNLSIGFRQKL